MCGQGDAIVVGADIEIHALNLRRDLLFKWTLPFHLSLALLLLNLKAQTAGPSATPKYHA